MAQPVWGQAAHIATVTDGGKTGRFKVPQLRLANAAAATRINRRIIGLMMNEETNSKLSVVQQLRQAERACCYDAENGQGWNAVGQGLTGCDYSILLNEQGLLSLEYNQEFTGAYSWEQALHVTFDLRTGRQLTLADLIADPPAQFARRMRGAITRRFGEVLADMQTERADSADVALVAEGFCWDWAAKRVHFQNDPGPIGTARAAEPDLENFALTPHELRLYYGRIFAHVTLNFEPDDTYHFPFARLQPRGLLVPLATAKVVKPK